MPDPVVSSKKMARGRRATWLSKDGTTWTLMGKEEDSLATSANAEISNSRDVTGQSYVDHKGFSPEDDFNYKCRPSDSIYQDLQDIVDKLAKDEETTTFYKLTATLDKEVKDAATATLSGTGFKVPVIVVPQSDGGDTGAYVIAFNAYENGTRIQGTVSVTKDGPTFTPASGG